MRAASRRGAARLLPGKSLANFDFNAVPTLSKALVMTLAAGDASRDQGTCGLIFGPPGTGKSHIALAIGPALAENGCRVPFSGTTDLVQRLQVARRELTPENLMARRDRFHLVILDDFACIRKDQTETGVLFELVSARHERRVLPITANRPFSEWNRIFPDETTAVERLVHRATILEMNVESCRRHEALDAKPHKRGRPARKATESNTPTGRTDITAPTPRLFPQAGRSAKGRTGGKTLATGPTSRNTSHRRDVNTEILIVALHPIRKNTPGRSRARCRGSFNRRPRPRPPGMLRQMWAPALGRTSMMFSPNWPPAKEMELRPPITPVHRPPLTSSPRHSQSVNSGPARTSLRVSKLPKEMSKPCRVTLLLVLERVSVMRPGVACSPQLARPMQA